MDKIDIRLDNTVYVADPDDSDSWKRLHRLIGALAAPLAQPQPPSLSQPRRFRYVVRRGHDGWSVSCARILNILLARLLYEILKIKFQFIICSSEQFLSITVSTFF